jgi:hypothetical protein
MFLLFSIIPRRLIKKIEFAIKVKFKIIICCCIVFCSLRLGYCLFYLRLY